MNTRLESARLAWTLATWERLRAEARGDGGVELVAMRWDEIRARDEYLAAAEEAAADKPAELEGVDVFTRTALAAIEWSKR